MAYDTLEKKIECLTLEQQQSVFDFINFLLYKNETMDTKSKKQNDIEKINKVLEKISITEQLEYCDAGLQTVREALKNDTW